MTARTCGNEVRFSVLTKRDCGADRYNLAEYSQIHLGQPQVDDQVPEVRKYLRERDVVTCNYHSHRNHGHDWEWLDISIAFSTITHAFHLRHLQHLHATAVTRQQQFVVLARAADMPLFERRGRRRGRRRLRPAEHAIASSHINATCSAFYCGGRHRKQRTQKQMAGQEQREVCRQCYHH